MAKRTPRSEANESTTGAAATGPKTRGRSRSSAAGAPAPELSDVFTARSANAGPANAPSEDDIRRRAYQRYLERGGGHGLDFDDWLEAERELRQGGR